MSEGLVGLAMLLGAAALAILVVVAARRADARRGMTPEQSRSSGLMSNKGSSPASFGDFRHFPDDDQPIS